MRRRQSASEIGALLDQWLETEFTFIRVESMAQGLARLGRKDQPFILDLVRRLASTHVELAHQFALRAADALALLGPQGIQDWITLAADRYDSAGLTPALALIRDPRGFFDGARERRCGAYLEQQRNVLTSFVRGLSGRQLELEADGEAWTDGETLYLPPVLARLDSPEGNFMLYKAMTAHLWAQTRFGSLRPAFAQQFAGYPDAGHAAGLYHHFERLRLDACLQRELPGLHRQMAELRRLLGDREPELVDQGLLRPEADAGDSLDLVPACYHRPLPAPVCYQGRFWPERVEERRLARIAREKALIRVRLGELLDQLEREGRPRRPDDRFTLPERPPGADPGETVSELWLDGRPLAPPEDARALLQSVLLDLGELPEDYLHPAGEGEYDISSYRRAAARVEDVWSGAYHEQGAFLYHEWDFRRQLYRKNWCVVREHEVEPGDGHFYAATLAQYRHLVSQLRRGFELLRGEDRLLKRQRYGEGIDIDALVDAWTDQRCGLEFSDRLFTRLQREDRNIAVLLMVDLSGSTRGWINRAEREALVLLCEALGILGDRFAIYGFSGWGRKRCELFRVKGFDEPLSEAVKGRIAALEAKDYTRMGPAIRHLTYRLGEVAARIRLLVTLSDGKPDDYDSEYRGDYGIEDTRRALFEAQRRGVHAYCVTIDREGRDYLPHLYGAANFTVIDQVAQLPLKVSDIYRKITSR